MVYGKMKNQVLIFTFILLIAFSFSCRKEAEKPPVPVSDFEGNSYKTIKAGTQVWMAENLRSTKFNDGTEISPVTETARWKDFIAPGYCWYANDSIANSATYGALYNGYAVNSGNLCPTGWHIPVVDDWQQLREFLTDTISEGGKLKEVGTAHWMSPNKGATNSCGFSALPSGFRYTDGSFTAIQYYTGFWSASEIGTDNEWFLGLYYGDASATMSSVSKKYGLSVRCVKD
jgi:uncharacterized protein (TIGR02145 family)